MNSDDITLINQANNIVNFGYEKKLRDYAAEEIESERELNAMLHDLGNEIYTIESIEEDFKCLQLEVGENSSNLDLLFHIIEVQSENIKQLLDFHNLNEIKRDISKCLKPREIS